MKTRNNFTIAKAIAARKCEVCGSRLAICRSTLPSLNPTICHNQFIESLAVELCHCQELDVPDLAEQLKLLADFRTISWSNRPAAAKIMAEIMLQLWSKDKRFKDVEINTRPYESRIRERVANMKDVEAPPTRPQRGVGISA